MVRKAAGAVVAVLLALAMPSTPSAFFMNFEEGVGNDGGHIIGVPGVTFINSAGLPWVYADANTASYNVTSVNTGISWGTGRYNMYDYAFAWLGIAGNWGRIDFDDVNGTWFQTGVSSATTFTLAAYDINDVEIDSAVQPGGSTQWDGFTDMAWLRVDAPAGQNIAYVKMWDAGNYWEVDQMSGDMEGGVIPEPSTLLLMGSALVGMAWFARRKLLKR